MHRLVLIDNRGGNCAIEFSFDTQLAFVVSGIITAIPSSGIVEAGCQAPVSMKLHAPAATQALDFSIPVAIRVHTVLATATVREEFSAGGPFTSMGSAHQHRNQLSKITRISVAERTTASHRSKVQHSASTTARHLERRATVSGRGAYERGTSKLTGAHGPVSSIACQVGRVLKCDDAVSVLSSQLTVALSTADGRKLSDSQRESCVTHANAITGYASPCSLGKGYTESGTYDCEVEQPHMLTLFVHITARIVSRHAFARSHTASALDLHILQLPPPESALDSLGNVPESALCITNRTADIHAHTATIITLMERVMHDSFADPLTTVSSKVRPVILRDDFDINDLRTALYDVFVARRSAAIRHMPASVSSPLACEAAAQTLQWIECNARAALQA